MKKIDLSRPDFLFAYVWVITTWLAYADLYWMGFDSSPRMTALIAGNVISFFVVYRLVRALAFSKAHTQAPAATPSMTALSKLNVALFGIWFVLFVYITYKSGGYPIFWKLQHIQKSYIDFGVPTVSGFTNMLRTFIFCLSILTWLNSKNKLSLAIAFLVFFSSLFELARANTTFLLLCGLAVFLVHKALSVKHVTILVVSGLIFTVAFGFAEQIRSPEGSGGEKILQYPSVLNKLPYGFSSVYLYLTTPVSNLYYADAHGITPLYYPHHSLQLLVPTIVREKLFTDKEYPIKLRRASHNATTFYAPFIADFGILIAGLLTVVLQVITSYAHLKAKQGDIFHQLIYAPLFTSIALSFFFNYFLTLGVIMFVALTLIVRAGLRIKSGPAAPTSQMLSGGEGLNVQK